MSEGHDPILSDEQVVNNAQEEWHELLRSDEEISLDWADGFKCGHRQGQRTARTLYEAELATRSDLLQSIIDAWYEDDGGIAMLETIARIEESGFKRKTA